MVIKYDPKGPAVHTPYSGGKQGHGVVMAHRPAENRKGKTPFMGGVRPAENRKGKIPPMKGPINSTKPVIRKKLKSKKT